ncbi:transposase, partial [Loigolactobacillus jiayinensis]|uniref:transposase n=1 Tax=Loigolactobacillus jiayinensis TaxID=2486016 RepID=UPI0013DDEA41
VEQLYYDRHLRQQLTQQERVQLGLNVDEKLANTYNAMQGVMLCLKNHDKDGLVQYLYNNDRLSPQMKTILTTFKKNLEIILNASESKYSNGP